MIKAAIAINSFAPVAEQVDVPPLEEPIFVLTGSQLEQIISRAIQPLQDEISQLKAIVVSQADELAALKATVNQYNDARCSEIAFDRKRIAKLEQKEPQPLQRDRGEILRALIAANGGKMLAKDARQKMHLSETRFSLLVNSMKDYIEVRPYHIRKNQNVLILK